MKSNASGNLDRFPVAGKGSRAEGEEPLVAVAVDVDQSVRAQRRRLILQRSDSVLRRGIAGHPERGAPGFDPQALDGFVLALPELRRRVDLHVLGLERRARGKTAAQDDRSWHCKSLVHGLSPSLRPALIS